MSARDFPALDVQRSRFEVRCWMLGVGCFPFPPLPCHLFHPLILTPAADKAENNVPLSRQLFSASSNVSSG
jgi:hypothetical protein